MLLPSMLNLNKCLGWRSKSKIYKLNLLGCNMEVAVVVVLLVEGLPAEDNQVVCFEDAATTVVRLVTGGRIALLGSGKGLSGTQPTQMVQLPFRHVSSQMRSKHTGRMFDVVLELPCKIVG